MRNLELYLIEQPQCILQKFCKFCKTEIYFNNSNVCRHHLSELSMPPPSWETVNQMNMHCANRNWFDVPWRNAKHIVGVWNEGKYMQNDDEVYIKILRIIALLALLNQVVFWTNTTAYIFMIACFKASPTCKESMGNQEHNNFVSCSIKHFMKKKKKEKQFNLNENVRSISDLKI